ncbi:MAG TPA: FAD-dependent monooxygenase [Streptosporangiaceae bacterium]|nr:FAD-dependent monooxygenase [Streptosporangiaceae bacterium]
MATLQGRLPGADHAVVLGASLAGMLSAAVLARHFDKVTVIERDRLPEGPAWRRGVPQARHAHNLMTMGHEAMERLFPGVRDELVDAGMVRVRMPQDMLLLTAGGWMPRFSTDLAMLTSSRDVIDWVIRRRLATVQNVQVVEEAEVVDLLTEDNAARVTGVRLRRKDAGAAQGWSTPEDLRADFVVDATGRNTRTPDWLDALGYGRPAESVVDAQTTYATCVFEPPAGHSADWNCILLQYAPEAPRQGILNPIEEGRWMVSLATLGNKQPPTDMESFLEYARTLRSPVLYEVLRDAEPVTPIYRSGRTENRRRHYERLRRWPDRFVVLGDAAGALNPSYGQGMSVAAKAALELDEALDRARRLDGLAAKLRRHVAKAIDIAWSIAATADLAYPWAADHVALPVRMQLAYLYRVIAAVPGSRAASKALLDINQMVTGPQAMGRPAVLAAALGTRGRATGDPGPPPAVISPDRAVPADVR